MNKRHQTTTMIAGVIAAMAFCILMVGCESRHVALTRPDGFTADYKRVTIFGTSDTEGLTLSKDGESYTLEVKPTHSDTTAETLAGVIRDLAENVPGQ